MHGEDYECTRRLSLWLMHTPPMRVFGLGLEPSTVCGWVSASVSNDTRTLAIGASWGLSKYLCTLALPDCMRPGNIAHTYTDLPGAHTSC